MSWPGRLLIGNRTDIAPEAIRAAETIDAGAAVHLGTMERIPHRRRARRPRVHGPQAEIRSPLDQPGGAAADLACELTER